VGAKPRCLGCINQSRLPTTDASGAPTGRLAHFLLRSEAAGGPDFGGFRRP
jgi:hypothetical protein